MSLGTADYADLTDLKKTRYRALAFRNVGTLSKARFESVIIRTIRGFKK